MSFYLSLRLFTLVGDSKSCLTVLVASTVCPAGFNASEFAVTVASPNIKSTYFFITSILDNNANYYVNSAPLELYSLHLCIVSCHDCSENTQNTLFKLLRHALITTAN